ncbi:hypothetical protein C2S52_002090 [Perilla frutescens var. hirtella]|nr:hypothetical protein C2S52_002090 [Perilla frutescens var. hirtella]
MSRVIFYVLIFLGLTSAVVSQLQGSVGVCNGRLGNDLPSEQEVVDLYKATGIKKMRIYDPNQATLTALRGSDIDLIVDVPNKDLQHLQSDAGATHWVQTNVIPHFPATKIRIIAVGNEVDPEKETSRYVDLVLPAMQNIYRALSLSNLQNQIRVSTATYSALLKDSYPPSRTSFKHDSFMEPIVNFLSQTGSPLLVNIYPYFAYINPAANIKLDFALFTSSRVEFQDNSFEYRNLFDAMVDGVYYALEKAGAPGVDVVVSESGWPSAGGGSGGAETVSNANAYYKNLIEHVGGGTPKKKGKALETYLFAMFDENEKSGEKTEQHFGLFRPNKTPKYQL